jgi:CHAT domain-containing protein
VLDDETLLLEYALGEERSYLWAITNNSLASYELPKEAQVREAVTQVLELLTARSRVMKGETPREKQLRVAQAETQLPAPMRQLSQVLLGPVADELGSKRLVIVADGALQYVPFAALPLPRVIGQLSVVSSQTTDHGPRTTDKYQPLIVSHEIISLPSASTLAVQRRELAGRKPAPNLLAVIADPVFAATDERMKTVASNASAQPESPAGSPTASLVSTRIIEHLTEGSTEGNARSLRIPRLLFTRREADQIIAVAPGSTNLKATDFKANRATVTSGELSQYRYVHFATHGYLDSERPGLSALVLSMVDEQGKPQDGFLRANEIYNLNLPAELVVLSACQTGLGKEIKGEGLIGLTRGFMYAGAARVVVSLWSVNDKATSELMAKFYQKMLKENQRPAAALRTAQVEMWKQRAWQSPYYWAAFVLQGEWR